MASAGFQRILSDLGRPKDAASYLKQVSAVVSKHRHETFELKKPSGSKWKVGGLIDTIYRGNDAELKEWGKFYLPKIMDMEVIGAVENFPCECGQLVMVAGEDRQVYAHDGEELHLVAKSLEELCTYGLQYPGLKSFYRGESFKDMSERDWDKVRKGNVGKRLDKEHQALVRAAKSTFMECLDTIQQARQGATAMGPDPFRRPVVVPKIRVP